MTKSTTTLSPEESDLIRDEGIRDQPYRDPAGHLTIGVGHNLDASGMCFDALLAQLRFDIEAAKSDLDRRFSWWRQQPEAIQRALTNLSFNLGGAKLGSFGTFLALLQSGSYQEAASDLLRTLYAKQVGIRAKRLASLIQSVVK